MDAADATPNSQGSDATPNSQGSDTTTNSQGSDSAFTDPALAAVVVKAPAGEKVTFVTPKTVVFVDNSGSMGSKMPCGKTRAAAEHAALTRIGFTRMGLWNSAPGRLLNIKDWQCQTGGGTEPPVIFEGMLGNEYERQDVFVITTDGEDIDVESMSKYAHLVKGRPMLVFLIHCMKPINYRVDVVAAWVACAKDAIVVAVPGSTEDYPMRVLFAKGACEQIAECPRITDDTALTDLPILDIDHLHSLEMTRVQLPSGFIGVGDSGMVDIKKLLGLSLSPEGLAELLSSSLWSNLVFLLKTKGELGKLHEFLRRHEGSIPKPNSDPHRTSDIAQALLRRDCPNRGELQEELRRRISLNKAGEEEMAVINSKLRNVRRMIAQAFADISAAERAGWTAGEMGKILGSNRARRAGTTNPDARPELDLTGAHTCTCTICCEQGVQCLLLKSSDNTDDMTTNFPFNAHGQDAVLPGVVCMDCGLILAAGRTDEDDKTGAVITVPGVCPFTRQHIADCLPLVSLGRNRDYWHSVLAQVLACGKEMYHTPQLLYGIVVTALETCGWCDKDHPEMRSALEYVRDQLLEHSKTKPSFRGLDPNPALMSLREGFVSLASAFTRVVTTDTATKDTATTDTNSHVGTGPASRIISVDIASTLLMDYPFVGAVFILRQLYSQHLITKAEYRELLHIRIMRLIIKRWTDCAKKNDHEMRAYILQQLHECRFGEPVARTARLVSDIDRFLDDYSTDALRPCLIDLGVDKFIELVDPTACTRVLAELIEYDRPESAAKVSAHMCGDALTCAAQYPLPGEELPVSAVIAPLNARYYRGVITDTHPNHRVPQFATFLGPSVIFNSCGGNFHPGLVKLIRAGVMPASAELSACIPEIIERRAEFLREIYGVGTSNGWADKKSRDYKSYNLHRCIISSFDPSLSDKKNVPIIMKCIIQSGRGYIHDPAMEGKILGLLPRYRGLRAEAVNAGIDPTRQPTLLEKLELEVATLIKERK